MMTIMAAFEMDQQEECPELSILTSSSSLEETPLDRFQAIQQKLDRYTHARAISREAEAQERLGCRLVQMEERLWEEERQLEEKVLSWREWLTELRVQAMQQEKRQAAVRHQRAQRIRQLREIAEVAQRQVQAEQERAQCEVAVRFEGQFDGLCKSLERECNEQVTQINQFEGKLQTELPFLHQRITTANQYLSSVCLRRQREVVDEAESFQQLLKRQAQQQQKSDQSMLHLICGAMEEMAHDLHSERQRTRDMKEKLLFLVGKAAGRIQAHRDTA